MTMSLFSSSSGEMTGDTEFRAFVTNYRAAFTAAGFVRTSDTGQIDPTTVARPAASGVAGYEIWRFNDAAQATKPIFFKFEYAVGATATRLQPAVTVGTGSNGSGTITGILIARSTLSNTATYALACDTWVSGGEGYLASGIFISPGSAIVNATLGWFLERLRLPDGSSDVSSLGAGIAFGKLGTNSWSAISYDSAWSELAVSPWPALSPNHAATTGLYRGTTYAYPYHPIVGIPRPPCRAVVGAYTVDTGYAAPFTIDLYGVPHSFRSTIPASSTYGRGNNIAPAMRYD